MSGLSKFRFGMLLILAILGFSVGRVIALPCPTHPANCSYTVQGCFARMEVCIGSQFGYTCFHEYGSCCDQYGGGYTVFCSLGCDGTGGSGC